ncbi:hypothetical protein V8C35DRAFT_311865 [Trichoderma chlorosporum]
MGTETRVCLGGAGYLEPEKYRQLALEALEQVAALDVGLLVQRLWVTHLDTLQVELFDDPSEEDYYDVCWSERDNNVVLVLRTLFDCSRCRLRLAETLEVETEMEMMDLDWQEQVNWPMLAEEAIELVRGWPSVLCSVYLARRHVDV